MKNLILLTLIVTWSGLSYSQPNNEPPAGDRVTNALMQLIAASAVKEGLLKDQNCNKKELTKINLEAFVSLLATKDKNISNEEKGKFLTQLNGTITESLKAKLPDGKTVAQMNYEVMAQNVRNMQKSMNGVDFCETLNKSAEGLYQKAMDNIRLIPNK